jgi:integrase
LEIRNRLNENINEAHLTGHSFFSRFQQYIDEAELSPLRKKQVKSAMTHLKKYNELTTFENINLNGFKKSLLSDKDKEKSLNTVIGILKKVRSFYTYARIKKWTKANPFENFLIGSEKYGEPIYITKAERDLIFEKKIENGRLSRVRDMFILQCLIGARIADFLKLTKDNIVNGAIEYVPAKTANKSLRKVRIPLCEKAKTIIDRYNLPDGSLVPYISAEKYNEYLKELFALCDLDRPVLRLNPITRKNEVIPLWKLATSHMARRTFIGLLHRNVKNEVIASMSGHTNDSRAFARYYKIDEDIQREAIESIN